MPIMLTFTAQQPAPQVVVTTSEPTEITAISAVVGSIVTIGESNHIFARGICWSMEPNPAIDGNHISDDLVVGSLSITLEGLTLNTTYYVRAYAVTDYGLAYGNELTFTTLEGSSGGDYDYVDLGLPSGILWATCNVGATVPEDYGDYFAWGETESKTNYGWNTYQYCMGNLSLLTKYCNNSSYGYNGFTDNLTILEPSDDATTVNLGADWRMPTKEEWQELFSHTTLTYTFQNNVYGLLFTSWNGSSLFLPASGYRNMNSLYDAGIGGHYWSSSLYHIPYNALLFNFNSNDSGNYGMNYYNRNFGLSIRAVRNAE